jgi:hypothetical protein
MVVISHFQQERLWEMGGDVIERAMVCWCVDWVKNEGTGAVDVLISWMDGDCAWQEIGTCMASTCADRGGPKFSFDPGLKTLRTLSRERNFSSTVTKTFKTGHYS